MKNIFITIFLLGVVSAFGEPLYLEVAEVVESAGYEVSTFVRIEVPSMVDATNKLPQVVADYFTGLDYKAVFHEHYHGPNVKKSCNVTPLKSSGLSKYVEVYTEPDQFHLPEIVRIAVTDAADADAKAKKIKKKDHFKDKTTKVKVKL